MCVFFPFILDVKFVGCTSRGHTGGRSHRIISHPPSFCGACLYFYPEKDSAVPFPRRPSSGIMCTNDSLIALHLLGIFIFLVRRKPSCRDSNSRPNVSEGYEVTNCATGATDCLKKNQNAPRPSEQPPVRGKKCQNVYIGGINNS